MAQADPPPLDVRDGRAVDVPDAFGQLILGETELLPALLDDLTGRHPGRLPVTSVASKCQEVSSRRVTCPIVKRVGTGLTRDGNSGNLRSMTRYAESGAAYKAARQAAGISQEALGIIVGTSRRHIIRIENGEHRPYPGLRDKIAAALGADPESLPSSAGDAPFRPEVEEELIDVLMKSLAHYKADLAAGYNLRRGSLILAQRRAMAEAALHIATAEKMLARAEIARFCREWDAA